MPSWYICGNERFRGPVLAPTASGFTPASLAGLLAWYKADVGVFEDTGGADPAEDADAVQQWNDQKNDYHLEQGTESLGLLYQTGELNSLPIIQGDNSGNLGISSDEDTPLGGTTISVFMVVRYRGVGGGGNGRLFSINTTGSSDVGADVFTVFSPSSGNLTTYNNGNKGTQTVSLNTWCAVGTIFDGANNTMYVNNSAGTPVGATPTLASTIAFSVLSTGIGGGSPTNAIDADVAEVVVTTDALDSTERSDLQAYFVSKWGI